MTYVKALFWNNLSFTLISCKNKHLRRDCNQGQCLFLLESVYNIHVYLLNYQLADSSI